MPNGVKHVCLKQNTQNLVTLKRYYVYRSYSTVLHCILDFPIFFIGVNQSTKYWMKVHVKYMFHTVKWAVPQNFRDKFFLLSVDNGFFVICLKNSKIQYGNWNFYINFKEISCVVLDTTAHEAPAQNMHFCIFFLQLDWAMLHCILDACHPIDHLHNQGQFVLTLLKVSV